MASITLANGTSINTPKWHRKRYLDLQALRVPFLDEWDSIQRYIMPRLNRNFRGDRKRIGQPIDTGDIINTTATHAMTTTANGMMISITSPARRWQKLAAKVREPGMDLPGDHVEWLQYASDWAFRFWDRTDLYAMLAGFYMELLCFGTASGFGTPVPQAQVQGGFVWRQMPAGAYVIGEDGNGMVNTWYDEIILTVDQVVDKFIERDTHGKPLWSNKVSDRTRSAWESGKWHEQVRLLRCFGPTPFVEDYMREDAPQWYETVFELEHRRFDEQDGHFLAQTPFKTLPAFCVRWAKNGVTPWGTGPGSEVLPDARQLQEMEDKKAVALTKLIDPPLVGDPMLANQRVSSLPGDVTFVANASGSGLAPMYQVDPKLSEFRADMVETERRIRRTCYADLFTAFLERMDGGKQPLQDNEIYERREEKLGGLGGVMDRLDREGIRPITNITLDYGLASGELEEPPDGLDEYDIEYLNVIAVAQRTQGLTAISDVLSFASTVGEKQVALGLAPTAMDNVDVDKAVQGFATRRGVDMNIMRDEDEREELREERAEAQAQQAELAAAEQQAKAAKDMAAAEELASRTQADQGPAATGAGPGTLPADIGAQAP